MPLQIYNLEDSSSSGMNTLQIYIFLIFVCFCAVFIYESASFILNVFLCLCVYYSISEYYEHGHGTSDESYNSYGKCGLLAVKKKFVS